MREPEFPLCSKDDPRVPVVVNMLRKSMFMGGNFTLDARRILAALDGWGTRRLEAALGLDDADSPAPAPSPVSAATEAHGEAGKAQDGSDG